MKYSSPYNVVHIQVQCVLLLSLIIGKRDDLDDRYSRVRTMTSELPVHPLINYCNSTYRPIFDDTEDRGDDLSSYSCSLLQCHMWHMHEPWVARLFLFLGLRPRGTSLIGHYMLECYWLEISARVFFVVIGLFRGKMYHIMYIFIYFPIFLIKDFSGLLVNTSYCQAVVHRFLDLSAF